MKVHLFDFQDRALDRLRAKVLAARVSSTKDNPQAIVFSAPTGSGKTVMMTALLEDILFGNTGFPPQPDAVVLWISDSPELNEQSRMKIERMSDRIHLMHLENIETTFDRERLEGGKIYFINTGKLGSEKLLTRMGDGRQFPIWKTFTNTANAVPDRFYVVIDEAHRGMMRPGATEDARTIMQRFLLGHPASGLVRMPMVIGISATPNRFQDRLAESPDHTIHQVAIPAAEVRDSGLLKERILIHYPNSPATAELTLLQEAAKRWAEMTEAWKEYCLAEDESTVRPILVVQIENATAPKVTETDLVGALAAIEAGAGRSLLPLEPVHSIHDQGDLTISGRRIRHMDASRIEDDPEIGVVFFKTSLSTGWDCPRAEVMMSYRAAKDHTYIAQLLGRMVRTPLARRVERDAALNDVHLFLPHFDDKAVTAVIEDLKNVEDVPPSETGIAKELVILKRGPGTEGLFAALDEAITYRVNATRAQSHTRRYMGLARGLTVDKIEPDAWAGAKSQFVTWMQARIAELIAEGAFAPMVASVTQVGLSTKAIAHGSMAAEPVAGYTVEASDADIDRRFDDVGRRLNGLHQTFWEAQPDKEPRDAKVDAIALAGDHGSMAMLEALSESAFNALYDKHKKRIGKLKEVRRAYYEKWRLATSNPTDVPWNLPESIDFRRSATAQKYDRHLYVEDDGTFGADLGTWEREVLLEELADPTVVGWLRNVDRKPWAMELPYEQGGQIRPMFPDLVLLRQEGEEVNIDLLEPHDPSLSDNFEKAKGMATFAQKHGDLFGRILLIRKGPSAAGGDRYFRLDMNQLAVQQQVLLINSNPQLDQIFSTLAT